MGEEGLSVVENPRHDLSVVRNPEDVLNEAQMAARALQTVITGKNKPVMFNGEQYLEYEDWATVAKFYGVTAKVVSTQFVDYGTAKGFEARAVAFHIPSGQEISAAEAMCLNDEDNWSTRTKYRYNEQGEKVKVGETPVPLFQLKSMAQTRACAKALRNVLAWVVVLAGYKPTPAEEMTGTEGHVGQERSGVISEAQGRRLYAIWKNAGRSDEEVKEHLKEKYGWTSTREITRDQYDDVEAWIRSKTKQADQ